MSIRSLAIPVLACLALAGTAAAQERDRPAPPESLPAPQVGQSVDTLPQDSPFSLGLGYRGAADPEFPDPRWFESEGIDSPHDADPREQSRLPRPEPGLVLELR